MRSEHDQDLASATARYNAQEDEPNWYELGKNAGQEERLYCGAQTVGMVDRLAEEYARSVATNVNHRDEVVRGFRAGWHACEYPGALTTGAHEDHMDYSEQAAQDAPWSKD